MANLKLWCSEKTKHRMSIRQKRLNMISRVYFFSCLYFGKLKRLVRSLSQNMPFMCKQQVEFELLLLGKKVQRCKG